MKRRISSDNPWIPNRIMHKFSFFSDSPYCGFDEPQVVGVALMEQQELPCDVVSNPKRLVFHWSFNGSADGTPLTSFTTNGSRYILRPFIDQYSVAP